MSLTADGGLNVVQRTDTPGSSQPNTAVYGESTVSNGNGVVGVADYGDNAFAIWGKSPNGFAGFFDGQVRINGKLAVAGEVTVESNRGILLNAAPTPAPLITRGFDPFDLAAGPNKDGHGRWGLFMEPSNLVLGIPQLANSGLEVARYRTDGSREMLMRVDQDGFYLRVPAGASPTGGKVDAYLGGDPSGGDVQIGSTNATVQTVSAYNPGSGRFMNMAVGTLTIKGGADLAEPFAISAGHSEEELPPGSVVVIDDENPGHLKKSARAYDTRVAGIISGANGVNTGIQLMQEGVMEGSQNVALTGRVYVLADATAAPIKPGDLLTTAATPGRAMKVTDRVRGQGAILGKAMSALEEGTGMVLVLITLQ
jgi:hypothetical protein